METKIRLVVRPEPDFERFFRGLKRDWRRGEFESPTSEIIGALLEEGEVSLPAKVAVMVYQILSLTPHFYGEGIGPGEGNEDDAAVAILGLENLTHHEGEEINRYLEAERARASADFKARSS